MAGATVTGVAISTGAGPAQAADRLQLSPTPAGQALVLVPGAKQDVEAPVELGLTVAGGSAGLAGGATVTFEFDPRLYALNPDVAATGSGKVLAASRTAPSTSSETGLVSVTVTLKDAVPAAGKATVVVGHLRPRRYPSDILRDFASPGATVGDRRHDVHASRRLGGRRSTATTRQPWGYEAGALWQPVTWGDGFRSYCARVASVRSVGPGPVPAGYVVRVLGDPRVVESLRMTGATLLTGGRVQGTARDVSTAEVRVLEWTAHSPLAADAQVQLQLVVTPRVPAGALTSIKHPVVEVVAPTSHRDTQRTTYLESVVRNDSIYDAESRALFV